MGGGSSAQGMAVPKCYWVRITTDNTSKLALIPMWFLTIKLLPFSAGTHPQEERYLSFPLWVLTPRLQTLGPAFSGPFSKMVEKIPIVSGKLQDKKYRSHPLVQHFQTLLRGWISV